MQKLKNKSHNWNLVIEANVLRAKGYQKREEAGNAKKCLAVAYSLSGSKMLTLKALFWYVL